MPAHFLDYEPDDLDVQVTELLLATADQTDPLLHPKVSKALSMLRTRIGMDVVFVSQFHAGRRTFRVVDERENHKTITVGQSDPLEESWCHHIVEGRAPQLMKDAQKYMDEGAVPKTSIKIGTHLSTPLVLKNGEVYGTLCCFSHDVVDGVSEMDLRRLQITAKVLAEDLLKSGLGRELELSPKPIDSDDGFSVSTFHGKL